MYKSKKKTTLGSAEAEIIHCLAENGPLTQSQTVEILDVDQSNTSKRFNSLVQKDFIQKTENTVTIQYTEYPTYWLTVEGIKRALLLEAEPVKMKDYATQVYAGRELMYAIGAINYNKLFPDKESLQAFIDLTSGDLSSAPKLASQIQKVFDRLPMYMEENPGLVQEIEENSEIKWVMDLLRFLIKEYGKAKRLA